MVKNNLIKELKKVLKEQYSIYIQKIYKSKESTVGNVYIIETKQNKYVGKIYENLKYAQTMIDIYSFLNNNNLYAPSILKSKTKLNYTELLNQKFLVIYSYLEGIQIKEIINNFLSENIIQLASYLRKIHDLTNKENKLKLTLSPINISKEINRYSILHFDLTTTNIFYNKKNNKIGFIDFDDAKYGPAIVDVSILIGNLFISKRRGIEIDKIKIFLDEYYKDDLLLKEKESAFIKECIIKWIDYITNMNEFDSSTKDSFKIRKELVSKINFLNYKLNED